VSGAINHGLGIGAMWGAGALGASLFGHSAADQTAGGHLFDATVTYTQAMIGFGVMNGVTGHALRSRVGAVRLRLQQEAQAAAGGSQVRWREWERIFSDLCTPLKEGSRLRRWGQERLDAFLPARDLLPVQGGEAPLQNQPPPPPPPVPRPVNRGAPPPPPRRNPRNGGGSQGHAAQTAPPPQAAEATLDASASERLARRCQGIPGLEERFTAARWPQESRLEVLDLLAEKFPNGYRENFLMMGLSAFSREDVLGLFPVVLHHLTWAGFEPQRQIQFIKTAIQEMGGSLKEFLFRVPSLITSLKDNGLNAAQIDAALAKLREGMGSNARYFQLHHIRHCMIGMRFCYDENFFFYLLSHLEVLKGTRWSSEQKTDFLVKINFDLSCLERFVGAFPTTRFWVRDKGWTGEQEVQFLTAYAGERSRLPYTSIRAIVAEHGCPPALQAELLTHLVRSPRSNHGHYGIELLDPFLHFLAERGWSIEESCAVLNNLAKDSGDVTCYCLPRLQALIQTLENQGWQRSESQRLVLAFSENSGASPETLFQTLTTYIPWLGTEGWDRPTQIWFLRELAEKSEGDFAMALEVFRAFSPFAEPGERVNVARSLLTLVENCNPYNRRQILELFQYRRGLYQQLGRAHFPAHLGFYTLVMARWPRLAYSILRNLMEATQAGVIPAAIGPQSESIFRLIDQTNGFNSLHYQIYLQEGEAFLTRLSSYSQRILNDDFGVEEARTLIRRYNGLPSTGRGTVIGRRAASELHGQPAAALPEGEKFVLGLIQRVSPTSGVSTANDVRIVGLFRDILEAGDLRSHIPEAWRNRVPTFEISRGAMELKAGERSDPEGKVKALLEAFRLQPGEEEPDHEELVEAMVAYLASGKDVGERQRLSQVLFKRAAASEDLNDKLENITDLNFASLTVLEEIFTDPDNLPKFLTEAFAGVPRGRGFVTRLGAVRSLVGDADGLINRIKKLARQANMPVERRREILANLLKAYKPEGIQDRILTRDDLSPEIKQDIEAVMEERPDLTPREIIAEVLQEPRQLLEAEKNKYAFRGLGALKIGLRAVKGPAFGLHGLLSGVCVAYDINLWKDPNFKLFAPTDEKVFQALGYIHVYETTIKGKKYITLPGINPSAEFLGGFSRKEADELFKKLMESVKEFAEAGDYHGVYIPTSSMIHSNRSYFQESIQNAAYPRKTIPKVHWNHLPSPYPFTEVFVVYEKEAA
jgi:hypothetical protein